MTVEDKQRGMKLQDGSVLYSYSENNALLSALKEAQEEVRSTKEALSNQMQCVGELKLFLHNAHEEIEALKESIGEYSLEERDLRELNKVLATNLTGANNTVEEQQEEIDRLNKCLENTLEKLRGTQHESYLMAERLEQEIEKHKNRFASLIWKLPPELSCGEVQG